MIVAANFLCFCFVLQGIAEAERIWTMLNAPLATLLPSGVDPNAFFAQHKVHFSISKHTHLSIWFMF